MFKKLYSLILGLFFVFSGLSKSIDSNNFINILQNIFGNVYLLSTFIAITLPSIEVFIGLLIIVGLGTKRLYLFVIILTILFTLIFGYAYFYKSVEDCGCMGSIVIFTPLMSFLKNALIILMSIYLLQDNKIKTFKTPIWIMYVVCIVGILSGYTAQKTFLSNITSSVNNNNIPNIKEEPITNFIGQDIQNSPLKTIFPNIITHKKIGIFIYSPVCSHCWNVSANINDIVEKKAVDTLIGITFVDFLKDTSNYYNYFKPKFKTIGASKNDIIAIIKRFPILIIIDNQIITQVLNEHSIPCGSELSRMGQVNY